MASQNVPAMLKSINRWRGICKKIQELNQLKNYGPWLLENNFKVVDNATTVRTGGVFTISGQQVGMLS